MLRRHTRFQRMSDYEDVGDGGGNTGGTSGDDDPTQRTEDQAACWASSAAASYLPAAVPEDRDPPASYSSVVVPALEVATNARPIDGFDFVESPRGVTEMFVIDEVDDEEESISNSAKGDLRQAIIDFVKDEPYELPAPKHIFLSNDHEASVLDGGVSPFLTPCHGLDGTKLISDNMSAGSETSMFRSVDTSTTGTSLNSGRLSQRKRRPGAAKERIAKAKEAERKIMASRGGVKSRGWKDSILAAAARQNRVWDPEVGWMNDHDHDPQVDSPKYAPTEKIHLPMTGEIFHNEED